MALSVAWRCAEGHTSLPVVYASRHGALERTIELLENLAKDEPLSPTAFSLSVHNSTVGLFSITRRDRSPATAVAAGAETLPAALLEGIGLLADGAEAVLVVYVDTPPPPPYDVFDEEKLPPFAVALLLTRATLGPRCRLTRARGAAKLPCRHAPAALMSFLLEESAEMPLQAGSDLRLARGGADA